MPTKRTLTRERDKARLDRQDAIDARDEARRTAAAAVGNQRRMAGQLTAARDEADQLRKELDQPAATQTRQEWAFERRQLRQRLTLSERARASLDAQVVQLGQANDRMSREAYDRALVEEATR